MNDVVLGMGAGWYIPLIFIIGFILYAFKVLREYERGVIFLLGRFWKVKGPGLIIVIPIIQQIVRVDLRTIVMDVPEQDVISRDNVSVMVNAVIYYRVIDAQRAIIEVEEFHYAVSQLAQTTLRSVLGKHELDDMLANRDQLNSDIQDILDSQTDAWGIKVANVEIKHVDLDKTMIRAMAKQAEAERLRRAKVISARGEAQAAGKILEAAKILHQQEEAMQIRYLTALQEIANERSNTVIFPFPINLLRDWFTSETAPGPAGRPAASADSPPEADLETGLDLEDNLDLDLDLESGDDAGLAEDLESAELKEDPRAPSAKKDRT